PGAATYTLKRLGVVGVPWIRTQFECGGHNVGRRISSSLPGTDNSRAIEWIRQLGKLAGIIGPGRTSRDVGSLQRNRCSSGILSVVEVYRNINCTTIRVLHRELGALV